MSSTKLSSVDREIQNVLAQIDNMSGISSLLPARYTAPAVQATKSPGVRTPNAPRDKLAGIQIGKQVVSSPIRSPRFTAPPVVPPPPVSVPASAPVPTELSLLSKSPKNTFTNLKGKRRVKQPAVVVQKVIAPAPAPTQSLSAVPIASPIKSSLKKSQGGSQHTASALISPKKQIGFHTTEPHPRRPPPPPPKEIPEYLKPVIERPYIVASDATSSPIRATERPISRTSVRSSRSKKSTHSVRSTRSTRSSASRASAGSRRRSSSKDAKDVRIGGSGLTVRKIEDEMRDMIRQNYEEIKKMDTKSLQVVVNPAIYQPSSHLVDTSLLRQMAQDNAIATCFPSIEDKYLFAYLCRGMNIRKIHP